MTDDGERKIPTCRYCRFSHFVDLVGNDLDDSIFECRRYAPRPDYEVTGDWSTEWKWPDVRPKDWCGEFELKVARR